MTEDYLVSGEQSTYERLEECPTSDSVSHKMEAVNLNHDDRESRPQLMRHRRKGEILMALNVHLQ
jgi:hypothetical protein